MREQTLSATKAKACVSSYPWIMAKDGCDGLNDCTLIERAELARFHSTHKTPKPLGGIDL